MNAILLVSHGSRSPRARQEIDALASRLAPRAAALAPALTQGRDASGSGAAILETAFLEIETPTVPEGLERCAARGAKRITVLMNFLNSGRHALEDIPRLVREFESAHPGVECLITPCVGLHPRIDDVYLDLLNAAAAPAPNPAKPR